ncbi:MAG: hypothetical protein O3A01_06185 [bacterium]|nr:hypothetical protein [bacterium]
MSEKQNKNKNKRRRSGDVPSIGELKKCKHCGTELKASDINALPKKQIGERFGVYWTGIEYPYIQIFKINCPNLGCGKTYSIRHRGATYLYK